MGILVFLCIAIVLMFLYVWYLVAKEFENIAAIKGYMDTKYFWYTFFLGIAGMLMVIALPNNKQMHSVQPSSFSRTDTDAKRPAPAVSANTDKNPNRQNDPIGANIINGEKVCPMCGTAQRADRHICWSCGQPFDN